MATSIRLDTEGRLDSEGRLVKTTKWRIADCHILLPERRVVRGDLVIDGKCIAAIEEHDCEPDKLVMPGLVNCHGHTAMTTSIGAPVGSTPMEP